MVHTEKKTTRVALSCGLCLLLLVLCLMTAACQDGRVPADSEGTSEMTVDAEASDTRETSQALPQDATEPPESLLEAFSLPEEMSEGEDEHTDTLLSEDFVTQTQDAFPEEPSAPAEEADTLPHEPSETNAIETSQMESAEARTEGEDSDPADTFETDVAEDILFAESCADEAERVTLPEEPIETEAEGNAAEDESREEQASAETQKAPEILTLPPPETRPEPDTAVDPDSVEKMDLPRIDITTEGGQAIESKEIYVNSLISVSGCDAAYVLNDCAAQVRVRGNSTADAPKKPYRIKFITKQAMLGLNNGEKFKSWCLMADYFDASMLRTWATFKMADVLLGNQYYSADCTPVEVYVNGDYMGVYLLCEQTQINKDRINITEKADGATNLDIGYLMIGQGGRFDEPESFYVYPEITVRDRNGAEMYFNRMHFALSGNGYTQEQKDYVSQYVSAVFKVVASALYDDVYYALDRDGNMTPYPEEELEGMTKQEKQIHVIDKVFCIESAVRMCLLDEVVKNLDAMTFNMYVDLSPVGDGRLTLAAPWDFDFAMGNTYYTTTHSTSGFYATNLSYSEGVRTNLWYVMLGSIDWFEEMIKEQWQIKYPLLQEIAMETFYMTYRYADAYNHDWATWGHAANRGLIHHHCVADLQSFQNHTDNGEFVNRWLMNRLKWLNRQWGDGTEVEEMAEPFSLDLTRQESFGYFKDFKRCEVTWTAQGLKATALPADKFDPYFTFDVSLAPEILMAEDYTILEVTYVLPETNSLDTAYACEFFFRVGQIAAFDGAYMVSNVDMGVADGQQRTLRIDLSGMAFWTGEIHAIRLDFLTVGNFGDSVYITSIALKNE